MTDRKFKRTDKEKYSLSEKEELGKFCVKYKEEYDKKVEENKNAVNYNERQKNTQQNCQEKDILRVQFLSITQT